MRRVSIQNIKLLFFISTILFSLQNVSSQDTNFWSNVRFGGNISIGFTNDTFSGIIAPTAIYDFTNQFSMGAGLNFGYSSFSDFNATNYGASIISLYRPFNELELSAEFEQMGVSTRFDSLGSEFDDNYWYPALFIGAGYRMGAISLGLRYDILYDSNKSIYASAYVPFARIFF